MDRSPGQEQTGAWREEIRQAAPSVNGVIGRRSGPCRSPNGSIGGLPDPVPVTKPGYRRPWSVGKRFKRPRVRLQTAVAVYSDPICIRFATLPHPRYTICGSLSRVPPLREVAMKRLLVFLPMIATPLLFSCLPKDEIQTVDKPSSPVAEPAQPATLQTATFALG